MVTSNMYILSLLHLYFYNSVILRQFFKHLNQKSMFVAFIIGIAKILLNSTQNIFIL